ncbi:hypothetical protein BU25DRAFT_112954 [Macroventuria anomochaeta]|uniref:Uncharacterized protein n=1 Tax=Macroventuria anomochaeta TaxID=301207 RepID=A0ACB6RWF1_9PLEO|nr:uncharacterized protein BU25DRAFT_112954 [Macroventuria anomochaeta]KAF2625469.1 hypothetical protein BU25DRAFT_112954 [Macroventuria anomochaeta]
MIAVDYSAQQPSFWPVSTPVYQQPLQQPRLSTSTQSSFASYPRSSNASASSQWQSRTSMASTNSSWSNVSEQPYSQRTSSLGTTTYFNPLIPSSYVASPVEEPVSPVSPAPSMAKRKISQRHVAPEKDPFATCISRTRRSRRSQREPRYWCTSCEEPFIEKYDWKRHEETYQERQSVFRCNLCSAVYFLEKDFLYHHDTRHNCETCQREGHSEAAKQKRQSRSGWGCGFCTHFSSDWRERCNHVAQHFERDNKTMKNWRQSNVIHSLLQRPAIRMEWGRILQSQPQLGDFGWNPHDTGRVEGYPENNAKPHLQDRLEYFRSGDDAAALAQLAFQQIAFPSCPPRAPRKDYKDHHTATLQGLMDNTESWNQFMSTIVEDDLLPTNVCDLNISIIDDAFGQGTEIYY